LFVHFLARPIFRIEIFPIDDRYLSNPGESPPHGVPHVGKLIRLINACLSERAHWLITNTGCHLAECSFSARVRETAPCPVARVLRNDGGGCTHAYTYMYVRRPIDTSGIAEPPFHFQPFLHCVLHPDCYFFKRKLFLLVLATRAENSSQKTFALYAFFSEKKIFLYIRCCLHTLSNNNFRFFFLSLLSKILIN